MSADGGGMAPGRARWGTLEGGPAGETPQRLTPYAAGKRAARQAHHYSLVRRGGEAAPGAEYQTGRSR